MPMHCPDCNKLNDDSAVTCKHCGADFADLPPPPPPRAQPMGDGPKYGIIIGSLIVGIALLFFLVSGMGTTRPCKDCKKTGKIVCSSCVDGTSKCPSCKGTGQDPQTYSTCQRCGGKRMGGSCTKCNGEGKRPCPACKGKGEVEN